ncbi:hypothetical protein [Aureivirga sp. CE67]|uniref:hypothetical protein n=1 Tax=Aureivirga sp. CE67 TaxID=1788983 RepID=UPI0018CBA6BA|nr:hypothetical protein [Aureivirga sp. CE67]
MKLNNFKIEENENETLIIYRLQIKDFILIFKDLLIVIVCVVLFYLSQISNIQVIFAVVLYIILLIALIYLFKSLFKTLNRCFSTIYIDSELKIISKKYIFKKDEIISDIKTIELKREYESLEVDDENYLIIAYNIEANTKNGSKSILRIYNSKYINVNEKDQYKISKQITKLIGLKIGKTTRIDNSIFKNK